MTGHFGRIALVTVTLCSLVNAAAPGDWPNVGYDKAGTRYSPLTQINRENAATLKVAWTYHTGDAGAATTIECTPVVSDGRMFITTVTSRVVALNPATGKELWTYDPYATVVNKRVRASGGVNRGVAYWSDDKEGGQRRVILGVGILAKMAFDETRDRALRAIDASHLFESSTTRLGIKRRAYLRRYAYDFIEAFAPQLPRTIVERVVQGEEGSRYEL
jgi:glucose dehydrogenase